MTPELIRVVTSISETLPSTSITPVLALLNVSPKAPKPPPPLVSMSPELAMLSPSISRSARPNTSMVAAFVIVGAEMLKKASRSHFSESEAATVPELKNVPPAMSVVVADVSPAPVADATITPPLLKFPAALMTVLAVSLTSNSRGRVVDATVMIVPALAKSAPALMLAATWTIPNTSPDGRFVVAATEIAPELSKPPLAATFSTGIIWVFVVNQAAAGDDASRRW